VNEGTGSREYSVSDFEHAVQTAFAVIEALGNQVEREFEGQDGPMHLACGYVMLQAHALNGLSGAHEWVCEEMGRLRKENESLRARLAARAEAELAR